MYVFLLQKTSGDLDMNWKRELQLRDLNASQTLEARCEKCGVTHYVDLEAFQKQNELMFLYLDELEKIVFCKTPFCTGAVHLAFVRADETEGFMGGIA